VSANFEKSDPFAGRKETAEQQCSAGSRFAIEQARAIRHSPPQLRQSLALLVIILLLYEAAQKHWIAVVATFAKEI
jgi:hypothetical protein